MRDPNRIFPLYNKLAAAHQSIIPDWRFLQFMSNFFGWLQCTKKIDPFFIEDDEVEEFINEFFEDSTYGLGRKRSSLRRASAPAPDMKE